MMGRKATLSLRLYSPYSAVVFKKYIYKITLYEEKVRIHGERMQDMQRFCLQNCFLHSRGIHHQLWP